MTAIGKHFTHHDEVFVVDRLNLDGSFICTSLRDLRSWRFGRNEILEILCQQTQTTTKYIR